MQEYASLADRWAFLAPWTARLRDRDVRVKVQYANDHTYRSKFDAIELALEDNSITTEQDAQELAEAVELVATALARCPDAWATVLVDQCECADYFNPHHEPLTARVEFDCSMFGADDLEPTGGQRFFHLLLGGERQQQHSRAFEDARQQLVVRAGDAPSGDDLPVGITIRLTKDDGRVEDEIYMAFVRALERYRRVGTSGSWCVLETIDFDWVKLRFDDAIVDRARWLVAKQPLVQVSRVAIHPRAVRCSAADLRAFVTTLARAYPELEVELGDVHRSAAQATLDLHELKASTTLVMQATADAGVSIKCLHLGQVSTQPHSSQRTVVWDELFGTLLHPSAATRVDHVALSSHRLLDIEADAALIDEVSARYAGHRTPSTLTLELTNANPSSVHAIVMAFAAELRHLCIVDSHQPIPHETVAYIVRKCPRLATLDLNNVALDSMDIFCSQWCRLSTLALTNVALRDRTSVERFLTQLADPNSLLGRHLGEFRLARAGDPTAMWDKLVLNRTDFASLRHVLRANDCLHTLYVEVEDETTHDIMADLMLAYRKHVAVRQAPLALASKVAWLSATTTNSAFSSSSSWSSSPRYHLSHDVVRHIFEFAAECIPRWVYVGKSIY